MDMRKCCVMDCNSTSRTHRLYNIPRNDRLRELWLSFLIPMNIGLTGLSKEQLVTKRVCQNHFDRYQFDNVGNRLTYGYPCLFSAKEVYHGIPLPTYAQNHMSDHNYCLNTTDAEDGFSETIATIDVKGDHTYATSVNSMITPVVESMDIDESFESNMVPLLNVVTTGDNTYTTSAIPSTSQAVFHKQSRVSLPVNKINFVKRQKKLPRKKKLKCTSFVQTIKKIAIAENEHQNTEKTFSERLAKAQNFSQILTEKFCKMNRHAQNFLLMQLKLADKKKKAARFTSDEKLLSLSLMKESPKGYRLLQKIFRLPSKRTINRLAENITFNTGVNNNMFELLKRKVRNWNTVKKLCSIVFDEVALTPHLTYVESHDEIRGFKDLGKDERELKYCDHALVFMIRGICSNWRQPIYYYFCEGTISSASLVKILREVVTNVSQSGLIPKALVCDQGSTFRTAIKYLRDDTKRKRILNNELDDGAIDICDQHLSIIFDPPHLLKGLRNNFLTKNMIFKGKIASWDDILSVYNIDCQLGHTRMNKKLTEQHVIADKIKKMKVSMAVQVLSANTSAMLKYTSQFENLRSGEKVSETMATTAEAVEFMDKLFDSVNGSRRSTTKGKLRGPIKPTSTHFAFWREAKEILKDIKFIDCCSKKAILTQKEYFVRVPSLDGWNTTIDSMERISKLLFENYGVLYFYPRNLNQDPLENFFGRIRALNYRNVNPDANTFVNSFKSLLISNVMGPHSIYSNCEDDTGETIIDFVNLLKRTNNKENIDPQIVRNIMLDPNTSTAQTNSSTNLLNLVISERTKVHSCAYTAGYLCRKMTKKMNCIRCNKTFTALEKENIHEWIAHREYRGLKYSNLSYPSKEFLILYRDIAEFIHSYMNKFAYQKNVGHNVRHVISSHFRLQWLGCEIHNKVLSAWFLKLICRLHLHNWCNITNKILKGGIHEKYVNRMKLPQKLAVDKYKINKLRNKKNK